MWNTSEPGFPDLLEIEEDSVSSHFMADNGWFIASANSTHLTPFAAQFLHDHVQGESNGLVTELLEEADVKSKVSGKEEF